GMELSRAYLMAVLGKYAPGISLAVITLLFTLLSIPLGTFLKFDSPRSAIEISGTLLLPSLAENLLASLLAFGGGPLVSILYRGVLMGVKWFFPILPNLDWFITALLGTLTPAIGMLMVHNHLQARSAQSNAQAGAEVKAEGFNLAWAFVAVIGLLLVGFNTGLFGVQPTLIASNSMSPKFWVGDIVVTQKTAPADIQIGDVIRYRDGSRSIVHRVVEVQRSGGMSVFITRGDANDADDPPVVEQALQGKVVMVIPKLGWVSIFIRRLLAGSSG
ncbi:MAG: signal peptidase I, partial [Anaerolineae bacterium]|nr:signal peptidase I [Anaerolineae bacterium]